MGKRNYLKFKDRQLLFDEVLESNPKPVPGTFYIVPKGAFIDTISIKAYGRDRNSDIVEANKQLLDKRNIETISGLPQIYPNDSLWLPEDDLESVEEEEIAYDSPDEVAIRINGKIFRGWTTNSISRSINTIADGFSFSAPYNPDDEDSEYLDPFTYLKTDLFIGGQLYISGRSESWADSSSTDSTMTAIQVRSLAGVLVDCPSEKKELNFNKQTLRQITDALLKPFGIKFEFPLGDSDIFDATKRGKTDKIASYLQSLAKKAGFIMNSTNQGGIKYDRANIDGKPIMALIQGHPPLVSITSNFNGSERFSDWIAIGQSKGNVANSFTLKDDSIPVKRPIIFNAKDTRQGTLEKAAKWMRNRSLAKSAKWTATLATWRDEGDNLIYENEIITVFSPKAHIFVETKLLIEKVDFSKTESGANVAVLTLVMPESYTLDFPEVFPWER